MRHARTSKKWKFLEDTTNCINDGSRPTENAIQVEFSNPYKTIEDLAKMYNSKIQGWINYYTHYYKSEMYNVLYYINRCILKWVKRKYKKTSRRKARTWLKEVAKREPNLFAHWKFGISPTAV